MGRSRGTLPVQLAGNIKQGGLIELAFGVTLREILYEYGGGSASGRPIKAVQVGGPLGAYLPESQWDTPLDYEAFASLWAVLGHGGIVVHDDSADMSKLARYAMEFCAVESCGKCTPCRIGSTRGVETIDKIRERTATSEAGHPAARTVRHHAAWLAVRDGRHDAVSGAVGPEPLPARFRPGLRRPARRLGEDHDRNHPARDLGTPPPLNPNMEFVTLTIDGERVTRAAGTSVMRAAAESGTNIPKLCATDSLEPFGSCRLCLVEIEGRRGYPASCTTPVEEGMVVRTQTSKLQELRKGVMELYISDHPLDCLTCPANGNCELQDMAGVTGLREVRYGYEGANHLKLKKDESNPYFTFDSSKCIVCNRCVRACEETQGTFALTISGRGFESRVSAGQSESFMESECVSCGACVEACPTATLQEKSVIWLGQAEHKVTTTCAYCGVGCSLDAEMKGSEVVRMVPTKDGKANEGHACVKGRFAWGYATHKDRILKPMIRSKITDPWKEVSWDEALDYAASEFKRIQAKHGQDSIGGIVSSRCTNEEGYLVQKLVRAAFGNNNVDTCARVCHSPTGYGLKQTLGESAGTQTFASVAKSDVIMVIGANPTDGHPVFASRMKRRLRQGAKLIVIDPRRIDLVKSPHIRSQYHLQLRPGTNVAMVSSLAHVIVTEGLLAEQYIAERCDDRAFNQWRDFVAQASNSPEAMESVTGVPAEQVRGAARLFATGGNGAIFYGLGVTEHAQGSTTVMGIANLAMATGNVGREGVGVNPLRGQNNVQGSCDIGSFPHELPGYRHVSDTTVRSQFEEAWGVELQAEPGLRIPNMFEAALDGSFKGLYCQGEDIVQSDPNTQHVIAAMEAMECIVVQDIFLNETAKYAHVLLPGSSFLEKDGTFTNAERRISRVRKVMAPKAGYADWEVTVQLSNRLGYPMNYSIRRDHG
jgi:formate dehydrogenase major subunit